MSKNLPLVRSAAIALILAASAGSAAAVPITTGSYAKTGIGAEFDSPYDNFYVTGHSLDVALNGGPVQFTLADYSFEVGPNCYACTLRPSFDALLDVTLGGVTRQLDLAYTWSSTGPVDSLTFASIAPVRFDFGDRSVLLSVNDLGALSGSGGVLRGDLGATLTVSAVPEPSSWMLMVAGLGVAGWVGQRRRDPPAHSITGSSSRGPKGVMR